jgi:hypothetical protein
VKATVWLATGLTLSTASGLNTWLVRNVLGLKGVRIGANRIHPGLLALWAVNYGLSLADAWTAARRPHAEAVAEVVNPS